MAALIITKASEILKIRFYSWLDFQEKKKKQASIVQRKGKHIVYFYLYFLTTLLLS